MEALMKPDGWSPPNHKKVKEILEARFAAIKDG